MLDKKQGQMSIEGIMAIVVGVIIGVVFISVIVGLVTSSGQTETVVEEDIRLELGAPARLANTDIVESTFVLFNTSDTSLIIGSGNYTLDGENGLLTLINESFNNTGAQANYTYEPVGYIPAGLTRTIISFIAVFIAIAVLLMVVPKLKQ